MDKLIRRFGRIVGSNIAVNPGRSRLLLKAGFAASGIKIKYFPDDRLLANQKYASLVCNENIRYSLSNPESSAVVNIFFPCELLHAAGIVPEFVEGMSGYLNGAGSEGYFINYAENRGIPGTYCSYHKALLGAAFSGVIPGPRFIINTTLACDANITTFRSLAEFWGVPQFTLDIPGSNSDKAVTYVEKQLREAASFIADITGREFNETKFKEIIKRENHSMEMYQEYFKELSRKYIPNDLTSEMYKLFFTHVLNGTKEAEEYFKLLLKDARKAKSAGDKIRIIWCHTLPYWQKSIREIFNDSSKYQLLCTELNYDTVIELDEKNPFRSLAVKLLDNHMRGPAERRAEKLLQIAKYLKADGVIYFNHWGCKKTLGASGLVRKKLENNKFPVLILNGDGCDRDNINDGQMVTRLQAFLEILEGRNNEICL